MKSFNDLKIITPILDALREEGYTMPTAIQEMSIPSILAQKDLLGCAQTGTGKTAAFTIPVLQLLHSTKTHERNKRSIKAVVLCPTRELAMQIGESFSSYGKYTNVKHLVIYGGVSQTPQVAALKKGIDVLIATPGRLKDLMNQRHVVLSDVELLVLDEADRMLDMGFIHDIKLVLSKLPEKKQSLFFTATVTQEINKLVSSILKNPVKVEVTPVSTAAETVEQSVYYVEKNKKRSLLKFLLQDESVEGVLVFTRTKHGADRLAKDLTKEGIKSDAIHGNKSQQARQRALADFKQKKIRVLVATDVAARGIDIEKLSHVINYDLPNEPETYIHRIGRTGRAGASGVAIAFCDSEEKAFLKQINKLLKKEIPVAQNNPFSSTGLKKTSDQKENTGNVNEKKPNQWQMKRKFIKKRKAARKSNASPGVR